MKSFEFIIEGEVVPFKQPTKTLSWNMLDDGMSMEDKLYVFEVFHTKGSLTESLDDDKKAYFVSLFNMSASPIRGKNYIVVPLSLVGNRILPLDTPSIAEFVAQSNDTLPTLTFNTSNGEKKYPAKTMRDLAFYNTFTFPSTSLYDKFRTALSLKFDISLPDVGKYKQQGISEGDVVPFKQPSKTLSWQQVPKDVLLIANDWFWASEDNSGLDATIDPEGYGNGTSNDVKYLAAKLQQKGWTIDFNDEYDAPLGPFNLRLTNSRGQNVLLSIEDAQDFTGWAKGTSSYN